MKRVGRCDAYATEFDLEAEEYVPLPKVSDFIFLPVPMQPCVLRILCGIGKKQSSPALKVVVGLLAHLCQQIQCILQCRTALLLTYLTPTCGAHLCQQTHHILQCRTAVLLTYILADICCLAAGVIQLGLLCLSWTL